MPKEITRRKIIHGAGIGLALLGLWYVANGLHGQWAQLAPVLAQPESWLRIAFGSLAWAAAVVLLAAIWANLVVSGISTEPRPKPFRRGPLMMIYCLSNLAKYLPGNIVHFASRQMQAASLGYRHKDIAAASLAESAGLLVAAVLVGFVPLLFLGGTAEVLEQFQAAAGDSAPVFGGVAGIAILLALAAMFARSRQPAATLKKMILAITGAAAGATAFFIIVFGIVLLVAGNTGEMAAKPALVPAIYILSWVFGYLLPGPRQGLACGKPPFSCWRKP